ncbi:MAG: peptidylprolyl isomerase [Acetobacteraceae bacterium]|nr:peptidylprolyl isomerase [Acetobacteraceae bacterium]
MQPAQAAPAGPEERLVIEVVDAQGRSRGAPIVIQLLPELAPNHVQRIKTLTSQGFYNGTPFHRVIEGFMAQGGDKTGSGMGGRDQTGMPDLRAEFTPPSRQRFVRGTVGMARGGDPNSANSQFFIMFAPSPGLDGQYTIWGRVVSGMETVDAIKRGDSARNGTVTQPDRIARASLAPA